MIGLLALAAASAAQPEKSADVVEPSMMIVEFEEPAKFAGFPARCPGSDADANPEEEVCLAELYEGRAVRIRHLAGPRLTSVFRLRTTAHSAHVYLRPGIQIIVATIPFEDKGTRGEFAYWWMPPDKHGRICVADEELRTWPDGPVRKVLASGKYRHFKSQGYDEAQDFRCILE